MCPPARLTHLVCLAALSACQGRSYSAPADRAPPPPVQASTVYLGDTLPPVQEQGVATAGGNLVVAADQEPATLNFQLDAAEIWSRRIGGLILDSLAQPHPETWQPTPHLAERWSVSGPLLTFTLRAGLVWDDGVPLTADDVVFTFTMLRQPGAHAAAARALLAPLESVTKVDERTVQFRFTQPYAFAFAAVSETAIYPRHIYAGGDFSSHPANRAPVGSGPYRLVRWVAGDKIVLTRNPRYWGRPPPLQNITFKIFTLPEVRLQALKRGDVDVIERLTPQLWQQATEDDAIAARFWRLRHIPSELQWLGYNERRPYFATAQLRRALTLLIDRAALVRDVRLGVDALATSWFYPGAKEHLAELQPWPYDPAQGLRILDTGGWQDHDGDGVRDNHGVPLAFSLIYPAGSGMYEALATRLRAALGSAQIKVTLAPLPWPSFTERLTGGDFDACLSLWNMVPNADPYPIWHSSAVGARGFNFVGFADPQADALLDAARQTLDADSRTTMYQHLNNILHREEPYTMLFYRYHLSLVAKRLGGVYSTPYGLLPYEHMYIRTTTP